MKKLLVLLMIILSMQVKAQLNTLYYRQDWNKYGELNDSFKTILPASFNTIVSDGVNSVGGEIVYSYKDSANRFITITIQNKKVDGNKDLEIPYNSVIGSVLITGAYKPLFTIWQKEFDNDADIIATQSNGAGKQKKIIVGKTYVSIQFIKSEGKWMILSGNSWDK